MALYNLGIDIGGTFIKYALVDKNYNIIKKWKKESIKFDSKDKFYDYLCSHIEDIENLKLIGISAPGVIDKASNVKSYASPNVIIMYGSNINEEVNKRTKKNVYSINDAKAAGLCEFRIGKAKEYEESAFFIIGSGTGGCICNKNGVIYGTDSYAGEFHHMAFLNYETGKIDRLGNYSSIIGLVNIYNKMLDCNMKKATLGIDVTEKYLEGEEIAKRAINIWVKHIVAQLLTISSVYNPEIICIGGGISEESWFIELLREKFNQYANEFSRNNIISTKIESCKYSNDSNIFGAIINAEEMLKNYKK